MSKITKVNLSQFIDNVEYDYGTEIMMFSMNLNGYLIPVSVISVSLEPTDVYLPANLGRLEKLYGITTQQVLDGIELCRALHGYS